MKKILVLVDGTVQANLALDHAIEIARALPKAEIVLLNIAAPPTAWQARSGDAERQSDVSRRILQLARITVERANIKARIRAELGETAEVVAKVAEEEECDHIFLPEQASTPAARALLMLTGLSANSAANRIISLSDIPVTVVAREGPRQKM